MERSTAAIGALAVGTFAIGTTEFVIAGLLPEIATGVAVSIPTAGLLVSGYALGVVLGAPTMTAALTHVPRKAALVGLLVVFVAGNVLSAIGASFGAVLAGRVVAAFCHGAFIGVASIAVAALVAPERRARAIAGLLSGLNLANVAGVPLGIFIGQRLDWRVTFGVVAALGVLALVAAAVALPAVPVPPGTSLRAQLTAFRRPQLWLTLFMTAFGFGAVYAPFTYVAPLMTRVAGFPAGDLPWLLVLFGAGLVLGNLLGSRAADRALTATILTVLVLLIVVLVSFHWTVRAPVPAAITLTALGVIGYANVPAYTSRALITASGAADNAMASAAAVAAFNLGNSAGAYLGGRSVTATGGFLATPLVGAAMATAGLLVAITAAVSSRHGPEPSRAVAATATSQMANSPAARCGHEITSVPETIWNDWAVHSVDHHDSSMGYNFGPTLLQRAVPHRDEGHTPAPVTPRRSREGPEWVEADEIKGRAVSGKPRRHLELLRACPRFRLYPGRAGGRRRLPIAAARRGGRGSLSARRRRRPLRAAATRGGRAGPSRRRRRTRTESGP